ncbi:MAG: hypothetical protein MAG794_01023 [Gammaproteobacteria bacterium]|nr:hypothetical protein [Gammaproteobacteria bacterium]
MIDDKRFSEELLNAYVDGELDADERQPIEQAMRQDKYLRERVRELENLKQLVKRAYADATPNHAEIPSPREKWIAPALAASLAVFVLGGALTWGWLSYTGQAPEARIASSSGGSVGTGAKAAYSGKVLFHLHRKDTGDLNNILTQAEAILATSLRRNESSSVRIIATGAGLSLFKRGSAPNAPRISMLKQRYQDNLVFNGCGLAYKALKKRDPDGQLRLLPEVQLVDVGVLELMRRQQNGWTYIHL